MPKRKATARWEGSLTEGGGTMALGSGAYEGAYSFQSRFMEGEGTNPEELIAAAHAGCFSMALSLILGEAGHDPDSIDTQATVQIEKAGEGFAISSITLRTEGRVPGIDQAEFQRYAEAAKENCPVSLALAGVESIELEAQLVN
jgi:osmotically inducible protein OsmC